MVLAGDLKPGVKLLYNNEPYTVIDVVFVKPGKGGAFARTKMKNLITQLVREVTFRTEEKLDQPDLEYKNVQLSYKVGSQYNFMDQDSFEEITVDEKTIEDVLLYIREEENYTILFWNERIVSLTPPLHMIMEVVDTPPGVRGDTAQGGGTKTATTDTGLVLQVPLFVNNNDKIKIDTRTGDYIERVK